MNVNEATWDYIRQHQDDDVRRLALQGAKSPDTDLPAALQQIAGRQTARRKLPAWAAVEGLLYPPHLNMEQCSSELTARYKAAVAGHGQRMADLTGGLGVDFYWMSQGFQERCYVEQSEELCAIARHNFQLLGLPCSVSCSPCADYLASMPSASLIFLDPARRNEHGGRTYGIEDCTPNVLELLPQLMDKADRVMLKLSPMLDWHQAVEALRYVREVHIVSVDNECKELLLLLSRETEDGLRLYCVNGDQRFEVFYPDAIGCTHGGNVLFPRMQLAVPPVGMQYVYEPNASVMKAGCFEALEQRFPVRQVAHNSHLFLSADVLDDFPGRGFQIQAVSSMNKQELKEKMTESLIPMRRANIAVRNFPMTADELRKKLRLKDGGSTYIFATTSQEGAHKLLICRKIS